jgi:hypothetical protein
VGGIYSIQTDLGNYSMDVYLWYCGTQKLKVMSALQEKLKVMSALQEKLKVMSTLQGKSSK